MGFTRNQEDFTCEHCGVSVLGNGYTNHCPQCFWSKHVDIMPGDRAEECHGLMRPIALEGSTPDYRIIQKCERCGIVRRIGIARNDSPDTLVSLAAARK